jgi:hypothetical protein
LIVLYRKVIHFYQFLGGPESGLLRSSCGLLAPNLPLFSCQLQLLISLAPNLPLTPALPLQSSDSQVTVQPIDRTTVERLFSSGEIFLGIRE